MYVGRVFKEITDSDIREQISGVLVVNDICFEFESVFGCVVVGHSKWSCIGRRKMIFNKWLRIGHIYMLLI